MSDTNGSGDSDIAAIKQCALDYAEGWYEGNAVRMRRALHPELRKCTIVRDPFRDGALTVGEGNNSADRMVRLTADGVGKESGSGDPAVRVEVVHRFSHMAMVTCRSRDFMDYLQVGNFGEEGWKIVNALWMPLEGLFNLVESVKEEAAYWNPGRPGA